MYWSAQGPYDDASSINVPCSTIRAPQFVNCIPQLLGRPPRSFDSLGQWLRMQRVTQRMA